MMQWSRNRSASWAERFRPYYYAHTNYVIIIVPSQSCLHSFLHYHYMWSFSICKIFHSFTAVRCIQGWPRSSPSWMYWAMMALGGMYVFVTLRDWSYLHVCKQQQMAQAIRYEGRLCCCINRKVNVP